MKDLRATKTAIAMLVLLAGPVSAEDLGQTSIDAELGSSDFRMIDQGALTFTMGTAPKRNLGTIYVPFDHYSWLPQVGFGDYNGVFPGFKIGVTSTGGAFIDPYMGINVLVFVYSNKTDGGDVLDNVKENTFDVIGLVPEVGIRINFPATSTMAIFGAMSWCVPMTISTQGAAISITTMAGGGVTFYQ
jgi:hypothetical protein